MKLVELRWTPYALPFAAEFTTAHGGWGVREGAILTILTDAGVRGIGEIAPLPSHGTAPNAELLSALEEIAPRLIGLEIGDAAPVADRLLGPDPRHAPLRCAIDTAALAAEARAAGVSVARLLSPHAALYVTVNAVVDAAACQDATAAALRAVSCGFRDIKLKVGLAGRATDDVARVTAVREAVGPGVRLRLDANGAWTEQQAVETLLALEPYDIVLIEQPVAPGDADALRRVRDATRIPVAADEGVTGIEAARALIDARAVDALVIKLPVIGGPRHALQIVQMALRAGVGVIVTSALDSGVGVAAALHVAATLPQPAHACGLATLDLLEDALIVEELCINEGRMAVPQVPGLGVTLDEDALRRFATGPERVVRS